VGEPGPPGSPASIARVRLDVVATLHQLIDSFAEVSSGSTAAPSVPPRDLPLLLSAPEAAKLLSLSRSKVLDLANHGEIPSVRIGRSLRIPRDPLVAWIEERTNPVESSEVVHMPRWARTDRSSQL
jgi:excisionase family DNA binding protein